MDDSIHSILRFFKYDHLPEKLQSVSSPFRKMAETIIRQSIDNQERDVALRKLLEAKDAAVRAVL